MGQGTDVRGQKTLLKKIPGCPARAGLPAFSVPRSPEGFPFPLLLVFKVSEAGTKKLPAGIIRTAVLAGNQVFYGTGTGTDIRNAAALRARQSFMPGFQSSTGEYPMLLFVLPHLEHMKSLDLYRTPSIVNIDQSPFHS